MSGVVIQTENRASVAAIAWPAAAGTAAVAMQLTFGVDLPPGAVCEAAGAAVVLPDGQRLAGQASALGRWPDGSVRWLLVDCVVPAGTELAGPWQVEMQPLDEAAVQLHETEQQLEVTAGEWTVAFDRRSGAWQAAAAGQPRVRAELPAVVDAKGRPHRAAAVRASATAAGPVRATVEIAGEYRRLRLRVVARWSVWAGGLVEGEITLHNPRRARHRGGLWDLGDAGSALLADFTQTVTVPGGDAVRYRAEGAGPLVPAERLEIYQDSSGGENWNSQSHVNRRGEVPLVLRGYRGVAGDRPLAGLRPQPVVEAAGDGVAVAAQIDDFWQQFPKAIEADAGEIRLRLFPRQAADLHELQGGEQKRHRVRLRLSDDAAETAADVFPPRKQPLSLSPQAVPGLPDWTSGDGEVLARLDRLLEEFLDGPRGVVANRERVDEYGWRNYGDLHADHEEQHYHGPQPLVSHYNNQFDVLCGFLLQFFRTGDERWMELAHPLARHVIDIDIYHTAEDRPAYSGGLFWFTDHYLHAQTSSHRTYSRRNAPASGDYGGGPSACHNFTTGLLLYHLLTGDPQARGAVLSLADWVLAQDDGTRTIFGLVDDGPTGLASATSGPCDHRPGRAAGNSINALLDGWLLTGAAKYLAHAQALIRRCVHPAQDIGSFDLLDAEKHWSYTVFLVSLDKYLRCKEAAVQVDAAYAFAEQSFLNYGRWMLAHERPYFDRADELEYPTEAWAAQELRKANALRMAARDADSAVAERMLDRGDELAERAWSDLMRFESRTTARAMAVVMVEGLRDAQLRQREFARSFAAPLASLPSHQPFLPQRERVKERLRSPAGALSLLAAAANPARWPRLLNHR